MTLVDVLKRAIAETKHFEVCELAAFDPSIRCKHGYWLCKIYEDHVEYENRRGKTNLYAADPHFFEKLKKLLTELCHRQHRTYAAFEKKLRGQS